MRRPAAVVLLAACLALAGCGGSTEPAAKSTAKPSPTTADPLTVFMSSVTDARFESYADGIPAYQDLEVFPPKWCAALKEGHSVAWLLGDGGLYPVGDDWGTEQGDAYQLVLLGVEAYCPGRAAGVKAELRAAGVY